MKRILLAISILLAMSILAYADRVTLEKTTGKLIEYQSDSPKFGNLPLDDMINNAIRQGYKKKDIVAKYVTKDEWQQIKQEQMDKPKQETQANKEKDRQAKENYIKKKLNLSDYDFQKLKTALEKDN